MNQFFDSMQKVKAKKAGNKDLVHGPVVEYDTKIDVANYFGQSLIGYLYVGTPLQRVIITFDTGSDWTTFDTDLCSNC